MTLPRTSVVPTHGPWRGRIGWVTAISLDDIRARGLVWRWVHFDNECGPRDARQYRVVHLREATAMELVLAVVSS